MIQFPTINEQHNSLRKKVRDFAEKEIRPVARELDEKGQFSPSLTRRMGEIGLFGMNIPKLYGGHDLDTLSYIIAVEEIARVDASQAATVASHNSLGIGPIFNFGTVEQRKKFLPQLCTGDKLWAFGLTEETAGSDARATITSAVLKDNYWNVNGSKIFITNSSSELSAGATIQVVSSKDNGEKEKGILDGVPLALPALTMAQEYQDRAARVGFDWPVVDGVLEKVAEEVQEIKAATNDEELADEIGDLFFVLVNLARWKKIDAESALRETNLKFKKRFAYIEQTAKKQDRELTAMTLEEMDALWDEAKSEEA